MSINYNDPRFDANIGRIKDNLNINALRDENFGQRLKSGDTTTLKYELMDGDLEDINLTGLPCKAVLKKDNIIAYETTDVTIDELNVAKFKITEVLPADEFDPYIVEFVVTDGDDTLIFPSDNAIPLFIYSSSLSTDGDIILKTPEEKLEEIVLEAVNPSLLKFDELVETGIIQENVNEKLAEHEKTYAPRLTSLEQNDAELTAQLAQTERNIDGLSSSKVGDGVLAEMGDLSQEVKESMTGGSVAVVGEGAVSKTNLANDLKNKIEEIDMKENVLISEKNIFNPDDVIHGYLYLAAGGKLHNASYNVTPKYKVVGGDVISISGVEDIWMESFFFIHFWNGENGDNFVSKIDAPRFPTSDYITFTVPTNATHFSMNIARATIPNEIQIEKSEFPTPYEPYHILKNGMNESFIKGTIYKKSKKNLYDGRVASNHRTLSTRLQDTAYQDDTVTSFIPVEQGKNYTISGLMPKLATEGYRRILGYSSNSRGLPNFVKDFGSYSEDKTTIFVDDERVNYIIIGVTSNSLGTYQDAIDNKIQVEEGIKNTFYEPMWTFGDIYEAANVALENSDFSDENIASRVELSQPETLNDFKELDVVRSNASEIGKVSKRLGPLGITYTLEGEINQDSASNNLYAQHNIVSDGEKEIYVNLANFVNDKVSIGKLKPKPFTIPSGQLANEGTLNNWEMQFNDDDYVHPDIAYSPTGVAGYKYWMISSIYPSLNDGKAFWEDEDLFVSNNGKDWERVKSLYEEDKSYTSSNLSLPPHTLVTETARQHAFLPVPSAGDTIEISAPADNGAPALDRVEITIEGLPWKHDPAIFIDGGYVYTYHSFHLPYADRTGGSNRFLVCVRTNDGKNWEVVRRDGSTMPLTEETSRQIFTKDEQGRYNYMYYAYGRNYGNPKVLKYGEEDYELLYGYNFSFRLKGTTPYNFDFSQQFPISGVSSGNHPGALLDGDRLYILNNEYLAVSSDRGESFTRYDHYPAWLGGASGYAYKKALCLGEGGKVILADVERQNTTAPRKPITGTFSSTIGVHQMYLYEFNSISDLVDTAEGGLEDGYIDLQIVKVNYAQATRSTRLYPYISNVNTTTMVNSPLERMKVADIEVEEGDTLHLYVTLNSRNGARIVFGGIEIE